MTAINSPRDKYNAVWIIFFILGLGTLLPWNFFMTATMYFTSRLKDPPSGPSTNQTGNSTLDGGDSRNVLESKFNNVMTLCAMVPLLIFTCLNSFIHQRIPQKLRISGSLSVILVVFLLTALLVKVDVAPLPFFTITMIKIIFINSFGAILQGSLFGLAGILPASYTTPIMSGQGLAGTFAAFSMICALASGSALRDSAFGYFITACFVILVAIVSYLTLPKMEFFQHYMDSNGSRSSADEENKMDLLKQENAEKVPVVSLTEEDGTGGVSVLKIFRKIWVMALSVCFIFTVTIGTFPAVTVEVKSTVANGGSWEMYFIPVSCFLLFNVMDWGGRSLTAFSMWPGKDSRWLPALVVARVVFVPLFMLCNVQPRYYLPVLFSHDAWYIVFMVLFSFSNGYLASLCMCFGPKKVSQHEAETAGAIMAFFLSLGLALGAAISFLFRAII
ncbi:equilibrative nucleoside transporter 1-like [Corythoichthys intestinalis]|uniref:equilibrative nucleoside transporter 1-like n=1 Tax=Corythoichthys intestinalis TaxID=161448 RepID=UPI0025A51DAC|nr:equilibrative nucleoside transporter 1-like [Corythoichthys intestinalis]XP_057703971.1 equilibrative nucleoside transporter 1-like [Corythoichthys intestinalis]XP_057703972.1 equilibrative nucleoside transporter 1-like [Corythoichthys intestinalis]XP_057703973.1 equilibrative nucleoside transporter 1-like [Corythoichthys intestinalis]XP_057703974.1 equilibrative nucleoside transporter 1-like [Corythoichthys intestinalis]XP_061794278.1 equilibrative nucleoside transporter 1-like isoform X2 